mgnify:CR=1 FL=1
MTKKSKFEAILNKVFGTVVNKVIFSADNKELVFPELEEDAPIEVGAKATYDGKPAEGEITTAEGKIYVFEAGILTEIKDTEAEAEDEITEEAMVEALTATLEFAAALDERMKAFEGTIVGLKSERDEANKKLATAQETIAKLKGSSKQPETNPKEKEVKKDNISSVVAQWKNNKNKKK